LVTPLEDGRELNGGEVSGRQSLPYFSGGKAYLTVSVKSVTGNMSKSTLLRVLLLLDYAKMNGITGGSADV
jgi:hypothetical protein